jgi:hypothetical protein
VANISCIFRRRKSSTSNKNYTDIRKERNNDFLTATEKLGRVG